LLPPPGTSGQLITMPTELLVPIAGARWGVSTDELTLLEPPPCASAVQEELLQLHIALYNATGKLCWWSQQHPAGLVEASAAVADALAPLKPAHRREPKERSAAEGFLATRSFGWKPNPDQGDRVPVLMPLIDLLNHHHRGAPFRMSGGAMRIQAAQAGSRERVSTMLRLALQGSLKRRRHTEQVAARLAEQGLQAVAAANISLLEQLKTAAEASQHPGAGILAAAAQRQAAIISAVI
jgi:hypothetical protein